MTAYKMSTGLTTTTAKLQTYKWVSLIPLSQINSQTLFVKYRIDLQHRGDKSPKNQEGVCLFFSDTKISLQTRGHTIPRFTEDELFIQALSLFFPPCSLGDLRTTGLWKLMGTFQHKTNIPTPLPKQKCKLIFLVNEGLLTFFSLLTEPVIAIFLKADLKKKRKCN